MANNAIVITHKTADRSVVEDVKRALANAAPRVPVAIAYLAPGHLKSTATGQTLPLHALSRRKDARVLVAARRDALYTRGR